MCQSHAANSTFAGTFLAHLFGARCNSISERFNLCSDDGTSRRQRFEGVLDVLCWNLGTRGVGGLRQSSSAFAPPEGITIRVNRLISVNDCVADFLSRVSIYFPQCESWASPRDRRDNSLQPPGYPTSSLTTRRLGT